MDKAKDTTFIRRHVSQLKVLTRLFEHELDASQGSELSIDRDLAESMLDTLEIFVEDIDGGARAPRKEGRKGQSEKPAVTRLK